jgi:hypothetical protein
MDALSSGGVYQTGKDAEKIKKGQEVSFLGRLVLYFFYFTVGSLPFVPSYK